MGETRREEEKIDGYTDKVSNKYRRKKGMYGNDEKEKKMKSNESSPRVKYCEQGRVAARGRVGAGEDEGRGLGVPGIDKSRLVDSSFMWGKNVSSP